MTQPVQPTEKLPAEEKKSPVERKTNLPAIIEKSDAKAIGFVRSMILRDRTNTTFDYYAKQVHDSHMFGTYDLAQAAMIVTDMLETGEPPMNWKRRHHIISNSVTLSTEAMLADFITIKGGKHRFLTFTPELAEVELSIGREKHVFRMSLEDALLEDYIWTKPAKEGKVPKTGRDGQLNPAALKDNWKTPKRRQEMLMWRAISQGVSFMAPDVSAGKITTEELGVLRSMVDAANAEGDIIEGEYVVVDKKQPQIGGESGVVDADYVVKNTAAAVAGTAPPAAEPTAASSTSQQPEQVQSCETASPAAVEHKTEPTPVPPPTEAEIAARNATLEHQRTEMLTEISTWMRTMNWMTDEKVAQVKANLQKTYGVEKFTLLDTPALAEVHSRIKAKYDEQQVRHGTDPISRWAAGALNA